MKTIALILSYNEEELIERCLANIYDLVDQIIIFEGTLSPFDDQPLRSQDKTDDRIQSFMILYDRQNKIRYWRPEKNNDIRSREQYEAWAKNEMLAMSNIESGDLIYMVDVDEFFKQDHLEYIISYFKREPSLNHAVVEEYQFAYTMLLYFSASHNGRFLRYVKGAKYSASQHFIYPGGTDISKKVDYIFKREICPMFHYCWVKPPELIRQKVLTFKRPSFTNWYNNCYLVWPQNPRIAYENNKALSQVYGWPGTGYAEGQTEPLVFFSETTHPIVLNGFEPDYMEYIRQNYNMLKI